MSPEPLCPVRFTKDDATWEIEVPAGTSLLEAARDCGAPIQTLCQGIGACVQCKVQVVAGAEHLSRPEALEKDRLGNIFHLTGERLGCQTRVAGPVVVEVLDPKLPRRGRVRR
ncbi:MAG: (2Fe-2S)-binding protein [Myxococcales bacterium]|nr:(2Fe-2S)-binding protein [Myxococcales bacterium]MCB9545768.1 (2Fe-2S)-binding protein [Myxococcales bacterium]